MIILIIMIFKIMIIYYFLAIPIGAILSSRGNFEEAYKASILFYSISLFGLIFFPIEDTLGIIPRYEPTSSPGAVVQTSLPDLVNPNIHDHHESIESIMSPRRPKKRHLPTNWCSFFIQHLPFSWQTISLLSKEAKIPQDWLNNFLVQSAMKIIRLLLVQYLFVICDFGPLIVAGCAVFVGFVAFLTLPLFLSRFTPASLITASVFLSSLGLLLLSIAGKLYYSFFIINNLS